ANLNEHNFHIAELTENDLNKAIKPMKQNSADLLKQLTALEEVFSQLEKRLSEASRKLLNPGIPISQKLIQELEESHKKFIQIRDKALELAEYLAVSTTLKVEEIGSLADIKSVLERVDLAEKQKSAIALVRDSALRVLERILAIAHRVESNFQSLLECQEKARVLQRAISEWQESDLHPDTKLLADGNHPFCKLLTLISELEEADEERLASLHDAVAESFGKTVAMAAVRGKLIIQAEAIPDMPAIVGNHEATGQIGDILTANENINMLVQGRSLPEPEEKKDAFKDFFENKYALIENVLEHPQKKQELITNISKGKSIAKIQMPQRAKAQKAADMPKTCFVAKGKHQEITEKDARQILSNLGLNIESVKVKK
ncbi:MAG: hypothetical protein EAZ09_26145, partial [Oscillatoriales cyanobacterium]